MRVELVFCVCCLCLFYGGGAAYLCTPPLPRLARFLRCISLHFPCLSLPFAMFPAALAPGMPGTPAPGKKQGKQLTGTQQFGLGYYGPIKHVDVHASQLLDPRVSRRMICGATCAAAASFGWSFSACGLWAAGRQKAYQGLWGSQACCGPCAYLGLPGCVDLDTSPVFANA